MNTEITGGVKVTVEPTFQARYSNPLVKHYLFTYEVTIENNNSFAVQLLRRHWLIDDEYGHKQEVEGPGVIGKQPILNPGCTHTYTSACDIRTVRGKMQGSYLMKRFDNDSDFRVRVPEFQLNVPFHLN